MPEGRDRPVGAISASKALPSPIHYATYFDRRFLARGLALYRSLVRHSPPFHLWVLCLDDETHRVLARLRLDGVMLVPLRELERADPALPAVKSTRNTIEYYFTCTAPWLCYLLDQQPELDAVTYLDADLFFFGDPTPIYEELGDDSILLIPFRMPPGWDPAKGGKGSYVVSMQVFRRTGEGLACLRRWREQSLDWCFTRVEGGRFGEQGYLTEWPDRYRAVTVVRHQGAGVAHWNVMQYRVTRAGGRVFVDDQPVLFYHFSRFRVIAPWLYDTALGRYGARVNLGAKRLICAPYARELRRARQAIRGVGGRVPAVDNIRFGRQPPSELLAGLYRRRLLVVTDRLVLY